MNFISRLLLDPLMALALLGGTSLLFSIGAEGQGGRGLTFSQSVELPAEGITFQVMRGAVLEGLPLPPVFTYRTAEGRTEERFLPRDLWYPSVYIGRWALADEAALVMARLGPALPSMALDAPISRTTFETVIRSHSPPVPATWEEVEAWLSVFADVPVQGGYRVIQPGPRLSAVLAFDFVPANRRRVAYLFRFAQNVHGIDPGQWYVALFEWSRALDADAVRASIERDFLASLATRAQEEDTSGRVAEAFQHAGMAEAAVRTPAFMASRKRAIDSIRGLPDWWFVETPNYVLMSDLSGGRRSFVRHLQEALETMRGLFEQMFPPRSPIAVVSLVRVFAGEEDYLDYVGPEHAATGGMWMPGKGELVIRTFEWGNERERRARIARMVYHEAFHQYIHYAFDRIQTSPWYNEGHATFFERADMRRDYLRVEENDRYADLMEAMAVEGPPPVAGLLDLDYDAFYARYSGDTRRRRTHYAMAWGLIYYLRKAAPLEPENDYETIIVRYEKAVWTTRDAAAATRKAFAGVDMSAFLETYRDFWLSDRRRHRARRNHDLL